MTRAEIEQATWNFLRSKGLPEKSTGAVMGNIEAESEFDPALVEAGNGIGLGLCQWSYTRRTQLESYGTDLTHQLNFLWAELSGTLGTTGADYQWINKSAYLNHTQFMNGVGAINDLTTAFCFCWERPAVATAHLDRRHEWANTYYTRYTGTVIPPVDPPDPPVDPPVTPDEEPDGDVYPKILASAYNVKQLTETQITFLKTLGTVDYVQPLPDIILIPVEPPTDPPTFEEYQPPIIPVKRIVKMKFTFNHNKRQIGQNYMGKKLTFDIKEYKIKDVRNDGYIMLIYADSLCFNYVNPIYIKSNI